MLGQKLPQFATPSCERHPWWQVELQYCHLLSSTNHECLVIQLVRYLDIPQLVLRQHNFHYLAQSKLASKAKCFQFRHLHYQDQACRDGDVVELSNHQRKHFVNFPPKLEKSEFGPVQPDLNAASVTPYLGKAIPARFPVPSAGAIWLR